MLVVVVGVVGGAVVVVVVVTVAGAVVVEVVVLLPLLVEVPATVVVAHGMGVRQTANVIAEDVQRLTLSTIGHVHV